MAVTTGTVHSVETIRSSHSDPYQIAHVYFTMSGTYAQADDSKLAAIATLIQNSRRNGKTVTLVDCMAGQLARKESDPAIFLGLKTVAISSADITFEITLSGTAGVPDFTTEFTNATAIPAQSVPFGIIVGFTEA